MYCEVTFQVIFHWDVHSMNTRARLSIKNPYPLGECPQALEPILRYASAHPFWRPIAQSSFLPQQQVIDT